MNSNGLQDYLYSSINYILMTLLSAHCQNVFEMFNVSNVQAVRGRIDSPGVNFFNHFRVLRPLTTWKQQADVCRRSLIADRPAVVLFIFFVGLNDDVVKNIKHEYYCKPGIERVQACTR